MTEAAQLPRAESASRRSLVARLFRRRTPVVSFPELVFAHFLWQEQLYERKDPGEAEDRYRRALESFERGHGRIVEVYWCSYEISAVALTERRRTRLLPFARGRRLSLHRVSDWATRAEPDVARALHHCDTLAVKITSVLRDTPQRVGLHWVYALMSYLLGVVDSAQGSVGDAQLRETLNTADREYEAIDAYYREVAVRGAQILYFWGMVLGAVVMSVLGAGLWAVLYGLGVDSETLEKFFACFAAGAVGAFVSVVQRVTSGHFAVDYELGRVALRRLGSFRPFIGAVFGIAVFFVVKSEIVQISEPDQPKGFYFLVILAFLAGFSERFAKDVLDEAADTVNVIGAGPPSPDVSAPAATDRPASTE